MNKNDEKVREMLENEPVPQELEPENIKTMLDEKAPAIRRSRITAASRFAAVAAACAVITGTAVHFAGNDNSSDKYTDSSIAELTENTSGTEKNTQSIEAATESAGDDNEESAPESADGTEAAPYMKSADSYSQVYKLIRRHDRRWNRDHRLFYGSGDGMMIENEAVYEDAAKAEDAQDMAPEEAAPPSTAVTGTNDEAEGGYDTPEYSDTYNQEENVLEADIAKTDGKYIYYIPGSTYDYYGSNRTLNVAAAEDGQFTYSEQVDITLDVSRLFDESYSVNINAKDMYIYNDMLAVVGTVSAYAPRDYSEDVVYDDACEYEAIPAYGYDKSATFVAFYTTGEAPELIDVYYQDGYYTDVRIAPDGYMYLISSYNAQYFSTIENEESIDKYIPSVGVCGNIGFVEPTDILLPDEVDPNMYNFSYSVIGSIDLNESGSVKPAATKALAGYTGSIYCSADNLYTAYGWDDTSITRIAIGEGNITPAASGKVEGRIKDQFSMSEYNGYFRVATTEDSYTETYYSEYDDSEIEAPDEEVEGGYYVKGNYSRDNRVYVLDLDMNIVGSLTGFGEDEEIKSVNFSGDTAYVVTYEQTDPLFAIDLSDPTAPTIMDEFKILGYSTYMQQWTDGLLLGFGVDADENAVEQGIKVVMFDNSDPYDLQERGIYSILREDSDNYYEYIWSEALSDRKALLIAPEKNLIGIPVSVETCHYNDNEDSIYGYYSEWTYISKYVMLSYEDGGFVYRGEISIDENENYRENLISRALYIGDYVYFLSEKEFIAADIATLSITDEAFFN